MKLRTNLLLAVALMVVMNTRVVFAQPNHSASQETPPNMMQECQKHQSEIAALVDQMSTTLAGAREQSDLAAIRAAMDKVQSQLGEIQHYMSTCPMAKNGASHDSDQPMSHMKCMSDKRETQEKGENSK